MVFEDRLTIDTPEGVPVELTLAGIGSRCAAQLMTGHQPPAASPHRLFGRGAEGPPA